ncbi:MAG: DUF2958 domain-containing protein [Planctomycetes bacterium]|nr:DUF2958 domain-containing protein [Planctomycetota bacterium]
MPTGQADAHDLIPDSLKEKLPSLYATQNEPDPIAQVKLFTPDSSWTWYVTEYDPADRLCFGLVVGHERELGYFSLDELLSLRGPLRLPVERDLYWQPTPLSKCH